jgi:hypothetical protein
MNMADAHTKTYAQIAESLLAEAIGRREGSRAEGYKEDKKHIPFEDLAALIGAGARVICLNQYSSRSSYSHKVLYKDHTFLSVTERIMSPVIEASRR